MGRVWRPAQHEDGATRDDGGPEDERLVDGLRRRAPEAFAGLHRQYAAGIYSLALRVVRHPSDAEDITQDVLLRVFERLPRDRDVLLRPWLYRLTLNRCYDHLRSAARRPVAVTPRLEVPSPQDPYDQSELQRLLEETLGDLTRRQRAALLLKDVHGLSLVEVGACLELTPGSVEVLLARARRAFRASFERRCTAVGRPLPKSAGALAALPLLPLPVGLLAPPALPLSGLPFAPASLAPAWPVSAALPAASGGGIGALLGLPASVKTAVLVAAAAASVGSAEMVATRADQPRPRPAAGATTAASTASPRAPTVVRSAAGRPRATAATPTAAAPTPADAQTAGPLPGDGTRGAAALETAPSASAVPAPHAIASPAEEPSPTTSPEPSPDPSPSTSPEPSPDPSSSATPWPSPSPASSPGA